MISFSTDPFYSVREFYFDSKCEFTTAEVCNMGNRHNEKPKIDCPCKNVETQHAPVNMFQSTEGENAYLHSPGFHSQIMCSGGYQNILHIRKVKMI